MIIELHLLQSFPVSNLNRDDVGQPKTATFGGHPRGRISSQCMKRSARLLFQEYGLAPDETGVRTKRLLQDTVQILVAAGRDQQAAEAVVEQAIVAFGFRLAEKKLTQYLLFVGRQASELLAEYCGRDWDKLSAAAVAASAAPRKAASKAKTGETDADDRSSKVRPDKATLAEARRILDAGRVADVALFGRMIADNKDFNVNAACQVAHALSTHAVVNEYDYYTAVDDLKPDDESGADMIGTVDFNAACYYRYANLDLGQLGSNLAGDSDLVARTAQAWLTAFINAVPSGKQNSMAARTMPETLLTVVRNRGAWNLANAFLKPVDNGDFMTNSTTRMLSHFGKLQRFYGGEGVHAIAASVTTDLSDAGAAGDFDAEIAGTVDDLISRTLTAAQVRP
ncbi:type I-E CRISPR-associated protein Cas7/Cse4/CasC [Dactylosporangium fulvum]|uniref:Type I-E CRISPR-associated protein Cas7/Cse4/CasC n=1 Tax=Dactylosporangium fulvum TaxID=53359 RepID=A0ABY5VXR2_9ACTN|nr:type I-E CRISPR-associated protein Cas7/Cse4/CasC [Dactylosporangium fulvum]UWP81268.1 type I-E CRISPR-associated protein Cas7/Cse4/CasC [Dactylosporangium fulvum]